MTNDNPTFKERVPRWLRTSRFSATQRHTLLFVEPLLALSLLVSATIFITQGVIIRLLDGHVKQSRVYYDKHSTQISINAAPNVVLITTSVISVLFTMITAKGLWILRHPGQYSGKRTRAWPGAAILSSLFNVISAAAGAIVAIVVWDVPFHVYQYELEGSMVKATREAWLCSLQDRDGDGVGDVQRWGSIGCRMSKADRWLAVLSLTLSAVAFGVVIGTALRSDKSAGYKAVPTYDDGDE